MDLSSTELFVEILLAGILFTIGVMPFLMWLFPAETRERGPFQGFVSRESWFSWIIALAVIYPVGIAGNRIAEVVFIPADEYLSGSSICSLEAGKSSGAKTQPRQPAEPKLSAPGQAEIAVRSMGKAFEFWVERHKTYRKLLRAGAVSSLLFLLSLWFYLWKLPRTQIFHRSHAALAGVLLGIFVLSFVAEDCHYYKGLSNYDQYRKSKVLDD